MSLPTFPFLSHCHLNPSLHVFLTSFLHHLHVHRPTSPEYSEVTRLVFLSFHRLTVASTLGSSLSSLPSSFTSIALLMDFASVYFASNTEPTTAVVTRCLTAISSLPPAFTAVMEGLTQALSSVASTLALPVPVSVLSSSIAFVSDCYATVTDFVLSSPPAMVCSAVVTPGMLGVTGKLYQRLTEMIGEGRGAVDDMKGVRRVIMRLLHRCIDYCWVQPLLRETGDVKGNCLAFSQWIDDTSSTCPSLLSHYSQLYQLSTALTTMSSLPSLRLHLPANLSAKLPAPPSAVPAPTPSLLRSTSTVQREEEAVHSVWSMLEGEISEDFARAVLREYDGDVGRAVDGLFSGTLPSRLESVKREQRREWRDTVGGASSAVEDGDRDMLGGDEDVDSAFQQYLLRTGRVQKAESEALSRSSLSVFEDRSDNVMLKERILASAALDSAYDGYDDEFDDSYNDFLSFKVDETAIDIDGERGGKRPTQDSAAGGEGGGGRSQSQPKDVREKWRKEEAERDKRKEEELMKRIEQIPPSRRTEEEKREWERLTSTQDGHQGEPMTRGMRGGVRGRGAVIGRGGVGRGGPPVVARSGPPVDGPSQPVGRGRGRGRGAVGMVAMTGEEREAQRLQRYEQSQKEKSKARSRIYSDDEGDEEEEEVGQDEKAEGGDVGGQEQSGRFGGGDGGDGGSRGGGGGGGGSSRGRGGRGGSRGWGVGPRGTRGRGGNHNRKALAAKKTGIMRMG